MIRHLCTIGLGANDLDIALNPDGLNEIAARSGAGKSSGIIGGICRVLWGTGPDGRPFPPSLVRGPVLDVALTTKGGKVLRRAQPRGGAIERTITRAATKEEREAGVVGQFVEPYINEETWRPKLGPFAHEAARLVLVPGSDGWRVLADGEGGGRPLRDVLVRILGIGDLRAEIVAMMTKAGHVPRPADATTERAAGDARLAANKRRDEAAGRLAGEQARTPDVPIPRPAPVTVEGARKVLAAHEAGKAADVRRDWLARRDALGPVPEPAPGAIEDTRRALTGHAGTIDQARRAQITAAKAVTDAAAMTRTGDPDMTAALAKRDELVAKRAALASGAAAHPLCTRPCCVDAVRSLESATTAVASAKMYVEALSENAATRLADVDRNNATRLAAARETEAAASARLAAAVAEDERLRAAVDAALQVATARASWDRAVAALGKEPPSVPSPGPAPTDEQVSNARATLEQDTRAQGAAEQARRALETAAAALAEAETAAKATEAEATRADALLTAVRAAPGVLAARGVAALGDLGPVGVTFEGDGVSVTYNGRPWERASTGEKIVADVWFRLALRRAMGPTFAGLPLIIDDIGAVGGIELPAMTGQVIVLRTTTDEKLTVKGA